jgi:hypothetical protein
MKYIYKYNPLQGYLAEAAEPCKGWGDWCCVCHGAQRRIACLPEYVREKVLWFLTEDCCESKMSKNESSPHFVADATPQRASTVAWQPGSGWVEQSWSSSDSYDWQPDEAGAGLLRCPMLETVASTSEEVLADLSSKNAQAQAEAEELRAKIRSLEKQNQDHSMALEAKIRSLEKQNQDHAKELGEYNERVSHLMSDKEQLQTQLAGQLEALREVSKPSKTALGPRYKAPEDRQPVQNNQLPRLGVEAPKERMSILKDELAQVVGPNQSKTWDAHSRPTGITFPFTAIAATLSLLFVPLIVRKLCLKRRPLPVERGKHLLGEADEFALGENRNYLLQEMT